MSPEPEFTALSPDVVKRLVESHRQFLAFLERRVESRAAAEDILQSAFAKGLQHGGEVPDEKIIAWFYRLLRNAVIDHYRRRATSARALESYGHELTRQDAPTPETEQDICRCITELLGNLKPEYADALRVVDLEEGNLSRLAHHAGITADNAAVRIHRARKALRAQVLKACGTCADHGCLNCTCKIS